MSRSSLLVLLPLACAILAGCSGSPSDGDAVAAGSLGEIRGVVVDIAVRPIPGVALVLQPIGANTTTDDQGGFTFGDLEPGTYSVHASRIGYLDQSASVEVAAGPAPQATKLVLDFALGDVRYANLYKLDGYFECGISPTVTGCSTANIATGFLICDATGGQVCGNFTADRSVLVQEVDPGLVFLQSEMVWRATTQTGESMTLTIGGATPEEFPIGTVYNVSYGPSPQSITVSGMVLDEARLGTERVLLVQVSAAPANDDVPCDGIGFDPCGPGFAAAQAFTVFTIAFYGYQPPPGWLFSEDGLIPPPPPLAAVKP